MRKSDRKNNLELINCCRISNGGHSIIKKIDKTIFHFACFFWKLGNTNYITSSNRSIVTLYNSPHYKYYLLPFRFILFWPLIWSVYFMISTFNFKLYTNEKKCVVHTSLLSWFVDHYINPSLKANNSRIINSNNMLFSFPKIFSYTLAFKTFILREILRMIIYLCDYQNRMWMEALCQRCFHIRWIYIQLSIFQRIISNRAWKLSKISNFEWNFNVNSRKHLSSINLTTKRKVARYQQTSLKNWNGSTNFVPEVFSEIWKTVKFHTLSFPLGKMDYTVLPI